MTRYIDRTSPGVELMTMTGRSIGHGVVVTAGWLVRGLVRHGCAVTAIPISRSADYEAALLPRSVARSEARTGVRAIETFLRET